ncbi:hypothetical protein NIES2104_06820 [Leptolyngbya sp. NIES-2104]|nr:hypothetical protein NIES2104_06820 [Leptolyngbya sp. NIES-2104]
MKSIILSLFALGAVASVSIAIPTLTNHSSILMSCRLPSDPPPKEPPGSV